MLLRRRHTDPNRFALQFLASRAAYAHDASEERTLRQQICYNYYIRDRYIELPKLIVLSMHFEQNFESEKSFYQNRYKAITSVEEAIRQKTGKEVIVRTDPEEKVTLVICKESEQDFRLYHLIQAYLPALIPWVFENDPLTEWEKKMLDALAGRHPSAYIAAAGIVYRELGIREMLIRNRIANLGHGLRDRKIAEMKHTIETYAQEASNYLERFEAKIRQKRDADILLAGYLATPEDESGNEDLISLFLNGDKFQLLECSDSTFRFIIYTTLSNFDTEQFRVFIRNTRSYFYTSSCWSAEDTKLFMEAIFGDDPVLKVRVFAGYSLDVNGRSTAYTVTPGKENFIGNPHIQRFNCLGQYPAEIAKFLIAGNYIGAVDQCAMSAASINMEDSTVMNFFVRQLTSTDNKCIQLPDGSVVSPWKALEWLKHRNTEAEQEQQPSIEDIIADDDDDDDELPVTTGDPNGDFDIMVATGVEGTVELERIDIPFE